MNNQDYIKPADNYEGFPNEEESQTEEKQNTQQNRSDDHHISEDTNKTEKMQMNKEGRRDIDMELELPNLGNLFMMWVMAIFSQCVDTAQTYKTYRNNKKIIASLPKSIK